MNYIMIYNIVVSVFLFIIGACFASFLTALSYRIEKGYKIKELLTKRSFCEKCKKTLKWYELIPVLYWLISLGKCKKCGAKIPVWCLFGEILLGSIFVMLFIMGSPIHYYVFFALAFLIVSFDIISMEIPVVLLRISVGLATLFFVNKILSLNAPVSLEAFSPLIEASVVALLFLLINIYKKAFGMADIYMFYILGLFFGEKFFVLNTFFFGIIIAGIFAIILVFRDKKWLKKYIPFIPFIYLGIFVTMIVQYFFSEFVIYENLLFSL